MDNHAASKLQLDVLMVQETHVNGLVDWQVREVEQGAARYGFSVIWLHTGTYLKGGLMVLLRDDNQVESQGPKPLASPLDKPVLQVRTCRASVGACLSREAFSASCHTLASS